MAAKRKAASRKGKSRKKRGSKARPRPTLLRFLAWFFGGFVRFSLATRTRRALVLLICLALLNLGLPLRIGGHPVRLPLLDVPVSWLVRGVDEVGLLSRKTGEWQTAHELVDLAETLQDGGHVMTVGEEEFGRAREAIRKGLGLVPLTSMQVPALSGVLVSGDEFSVTSRDGTTLERRAATHLPGAAADIPPSLRQVVVFQEDREFFSPLHRGVSHWAILRSLRRSLKGEMQGGSTIPMQAARIITYGRSGLNPSSSWSSIGRKVQEIFGALNLTASHDKQAILAFYLDHAYYGAGNHGWRAAARDFFGHETLSWSEAAYLASLLNKPKNPRRDGMDAYHWERTQRTLQRLADAGLLSSEEHAVALTDRPSIRPAADRVAPRFESAMSSAFLTFARESGRSPHDLRTRQPFAFQLELSVDGSEINALHRAMKGTMSSLKGRIPGADFAGVCVRPDGSVSAVLAGSQFDDFSGLNLAFSPRGMGSSGKWWLHLYHQHLVDGLKSQHPTHVALRESAQPGRHWSSVNGWDEASLRKEYRGGIKNYDDVYEWLSLEEALARSRNLTHVALLYHLGEENFVSFLNSRLGLDVDGERFKGYTLALGNVGQSLMKVAGTTTVLTGEGVHREPYIIDAVVLGGFRLERRPHEQPAVAPVVAERVAHMLTLATEVTSPRARRGGWTVGTKSGTNEDRGAYQVGYARHTDSPFWRGFAFGVADRDNRSMGPGVTGGAVVGPIVGRYLAELDKLQGRKSRPLGPRPAEPDGTGLVLSFPAPLTPEGSRGGSGALTDADWSTELAERKRRAEALGDAVRKLDLQVERGETPTRSLTSRRLAESAGDLVRDLESDLRRLGHDAAPVGPGADTRNRVRRLLGVARTLDRRLWGLELEQQASESRPVQSKVADYRKAVDKLGRRGKVRRQTRAKLEVLHARAMTAIEQAEVRHNRIGSAPLIRLRYRRQEMERLRERVRDVGL